MDRPWLLFQVNSKEQESSGANWLANEIAVDEVRLDVNLAEVMPFSTTKRHLFPGTQEWTPDMQAAFVDLAGHVPSSVDRGIARDIVRAHGLLIQKLPEWGKLGVGSVSIPADSLEDAWDTNEKTAKNKVTDVFVVTKKSGIAKPKGSERNSNRIRRDGSGELCWHETERCFRRPVNLLESPVHMAFQVRAEHAAESIAYADQQIASILEHQRVGVASIAIVSHRFMAEATFLVGAIVKRLAVQEPSPSPKPIVIQILIPPDSLNAHPQPVECANAVRHLLTVHDEVLPALRRHKVHIEIRATRRPLGWCGTVASVDLARWATTHMAHAVLTPEAQSLPYRIVQGTAFPDTDYYDRTLGASLLAQVRPVWADAEPVLRITPSEGQIIFSP